LKGAATLKNSWGAEESLRRKLQGLLFFRLALAIFFLSLTLFVQVYRSVDLLSPKLLSLYTFSCVLFVFTIVAAAAVRTFGHYRRQAYFQLYFDVGAVTVLIYLSGGVDSLFSFLYMPVILSAALLLYRRGGLFIAAGCSLAYGLLLDLQYFGWITPLHVLVDESHGRDIATYFHTLLMNVAGFFLVAYLSGYLAEEWLRSSEEVVRQKKDLERLTSLHHNIVESIQSGLLTVNLGGMVVFSNPAARRILGLEEDRVHGKHIAGVLSRINSQSWPSVQQDGDPLTGEGGEGKAEQENQRVPYRSEVSYLHPSGEELALGYTVSILHGSEGEKLGWVFIFQDLTEIQSMQRHVQRLERLALAGRIAAEISHEIKNPLGAMSGSVQMLLAQSSPRSMNGKLLEIVNREIGRIDGLITDFLWLTRGAQRSPQVQGVSVCAVILEILEALKMQARLENKHRVCTRFQCDPVLMLDEGQFRQVMWNLLLNALEAMPQGGEMELCVSSSHGAGTRKGQGEVRIDVCDNGPGIAPEMRDKVFEPFFTTKSRGSGLGLGITYQLMANMGGRVEMNPRQPSGTIFSLFFPL